MKHLSPELRKKIEEEYGCPITQISQEGIDHFLWLENRKKESYILGYREAIKVAKEWLEVKAGNYLGLIHETGLTASTFRTAQLTADFETDMNKFLEEKQ